MDKTGYYNLYKSINDDNDIGFTEDELNYLAVSSVVSKDRHFNKKVIRLMRYANVDVNMKLK
jgi:hypothetical protein